MSGKKRSQLRAINTGNMYDVTGNMRRLQREIDRGDYGRVSDMVVTFTSRREDGNEIVNGFHWGTGGPEKAHWIAATAKNRLEPA